MQQKQWDMADKLGMYLNDAADHGAVRSGVRERAMVLGNLRPGDKSYMLWRALGQFKMWPLAAANQILGREIAMSLSGKEMASNIGDMMALGTAGGALRMAVNDAASGNVQRDYRNPVTLLAALAQGGGLGIYGDFLFGETSRLGAGGLATIVGPDRERTSIVSMECITISARSFAIAPTMRYLIFGRASRGLP